MPPRPHATATDRRDAPGRARSRVLWVLAVVLVAGCSTPATEGAPPEGEADEAPIGASVPDPGQVALAAAVDDLVASVSAARDELAAATDAGSVTAAHDAADAASDALVLDPDASDTEPRALFPSQTLDRDGELEADDQLTRTLTAARDAGTDGARVLDLLRDPIAGDLGAWQRDPAGVIASIDASIAQAAELDALELAVEELAGLGTRAIAWTRLTAEAATPEDAVAYAERGVANLDVILATLDRVELGEEAS